MKTDVAIIGAGPAGLMLAHLLSDAGVRSVVLERQEQAHVLGRIRAGVLEKTWTDLMDRAGLGQRMHREGMLEEGFNLAAHDHLIRIDIARLTGKRVMVYGQTEIQRDLIDAAEERGLDVRWGCEEVALHDVDAVAPTVSFRHGGEAHVLEAQFIAGCDGFHGPSRRAVPQAVGRTYEMAYPFGWLGILADVPPCHEELIYTNSARGFALASMRSRTRSRYYIQVRLDETLEEWPDDRLWDELELRFNGIARYGVTRASALEKSIAPLRSFVFEPMRFGRLFLAGDAAHIVPPTGAKGLNLAASDVAYLADALTGWFKRGDAAGLDGYSSRALARVWKAERFSWYLTRLLHHFPDQHPFERRMQLSELDYVASSEPMQTSIAEQYVGLPL